MFARHDLVWLTHRGWDRVRASAPQDALALLDTWREAGWPAVVRRAEVELAASEVAIGFAMPPRAVDGNKLRVACRVELCDIGRRTRALRLRVSADAPARPSGPPCPSTGWTPGS